MLTKEGCLKDTETLQKWDPPTGELSPQSDVYKAAGNKASPNRHASHSGAGKLYAANYQAKQSRHNEITKENSSLPSRVNALFSVLFHQLHLLCKNISMRFSSNRREKQLPKN